MSKYTDSSMVLEEMNMLQPNHCFLCMSKTTKKKKTSHSYKHIISVPRVASAATWARAHARGAGLSRTHQHTATCPI